MNKEKEICGNQRNLRITNKDLDMAKQESLFKTKVVHGKPGKNDSIYSAHSYHTKVPHKAIMR